MLKFNDIFYLCLGVFLIYFQINHLNLSIAVAYCTLTELLPCNWVKSNQPCFE